MKMSMSPAELIPYMVNSAREGNVATISFFMDRFTTGGGVFDTSVQRAIIDAAVVNGQLSVVEFLVSSKLCRVIPSLVLNAVQHGNLPIIRYLAMETDRGLSKFLKVLALNHAAKTGHLDISMFLVNTGGADITRSSIRNAAKNGHLEIVKFLFDTLMIENTTASAAADGNNNINNINYLTHTALMAMLDAYANIHFKIVYFLKSKAIVQFAMLQANEGGGGDIELQLSDGETIITKEDLEFAAAVAESGDVSAAVEVVVGNKAIIAEVDYVAAAGFGIEVGVGVEIATHQMMMSQWMDGSSVLEWSPKTMDHWTTDIHKLIELIESRSEQSLTRRTQQMYVHLCSILEQDVGGFEFQHLLDLDLYLYAYSACAPCA